MAGAVGGGSRQARRPAHGRHPERSGAAAREEGARQRAMVRPLGALIHEAPRVMTTVGPVLYCRAIQDRLVAPLLYLALSMLCRLLAPGTTKRAV